MKSCIYYIYISIAFEGSVEIFIDFQDLFASLTILWVWEEKKEDSQIESEFFSFEMRPQRRKCEWKREKKNAIQLGSIVCDVFYWKLPYSFSSTYHQFFFILCVYTLWMFLIIHESMIAWLLRLRVLLFMLLLLLRCFSLSLSLSLSFSLPILSIFRMKWDYDVAKADDSVISPLYLSLFLCVSHILCFKATNMALVLCTVVTAYCINKYNA